MTITIAGVAKKVGIYGGTVSLILNGKVSVVKN
jgi:DNA-binding LacI/PurR family transcriptional regulator